MPACDRCYNLKSKCIRLSPQAECDRCLRLGYNCSYTKPPKPRGRRPKQQTPGELVWIHQAERVQLDTRSTYMDLSPPEFDLLRVVTRVPPETTSKLAVAPSKFGHVHASINAHLVAAPALLLRPFVALWKAMDKMMQGQTVHDETDLSRISEAVHSLRIADACDEKALNHIVMLGRCLVHFDLMTTGSSAHIIYRNVLRRLKQHHLPDSEGGTVSTLTEEGLCLVWMDTLECLVRRRVPVLRCAFDATEYIDDYTGISRTILPLLYEVCQLGAALKAGLPIPETLIDQVDKDVKAWEPTLPAAEGLAEAEVASLSTHASLHKMAALSILQQYRGPNRKESKSSRLVTDILGTLECCNRLIGYTPPYTMTAMLIVGCEFTEPDDRQRLLEYMALMPGPGTRFPPYKMMTRFLKFVWDSRDEGCQTRWFDLLEKLPVFNNAP